MMRRIIHSQGCANDGGLRSDGIVIEKSPASLMGHRDQELSSHGRENFAAHAGGLAPRHFHLPQGGTWLSPATGRDEVCNK